MPDHLAGQEEAEGPKCQSDCENRSDQWHISKRPDGLVFVKISDRLPAYEQATSKKD
jgi:hypothetical protein